MFKTNFKAHKWALLYCAVASVGSLCYGFDNTYYTGIIGMARFIKDYGVTNPTTGKAALTTTFTALTASIIYVGDLLGALMAAPVNDKFGRKAVFLCASICITAGAVAQVADTGIMGIIVLGRILLGMGIGNFTVTSLLYIGEVAPQEIRGPALMMFQFLQSCSQLVASGITKGTESTASTASYRVPMGLLIILPVLMFIGLPFIPESPAWFMSKGHTEKAEAALRKIHQGDRDYTAAQDLAILSEAIERERENARESSWISLVKDPAERRKVLYSCGAMLAQQINGILYFYVYGVIFAQSIGIRQPFTISLITNVLQVFAVGASVLLGNKVRRRPNLFITTGMMLVAFIIIGGIGAKGLPVSKGSSYVIVVFSYVIIVAFNFGLGPLAYTVASEVAVGRNRNKIMSCSIVTFFFVTWCVGFTAPYLYYTANLGPMLGFVYAGTTCISLAYIWFCVGETTGRSNFEINLFFLERVPVRKWRTHAFAASPAFIREHEAKEIGLDEKAQMIEMGIAQEHERR